MNSEEIFAKRDIDTRTLVVTDEEECVLKMDCKIHEYELRGDDFYFRGFKVIVKK